VSLNHSHQVVDFHTISDVQSVKNLGSLNHCDLLGHLLVSYLHRAQLNRELALHLDLLHDDLFDFGLRLREVCAFSIKFSAESSVVCLDFLGVDGIFHAHLGAHAVNLL